MGVVVRSSSTNCRSAPTLKLWSPAIQVKFSITCQMFCLKSNPASCEAKKGPPKSATPVILMAGPLPERALVMRDWCRRANCTRTSFSFVAPKGAHQLRRGRVHRVE